MHGQHREDRHQKWHMWPGPLQRSPVGTEADSSQVRSFSKAGRKIAVGDCALFQAGNAPPFIGIIRKLTTEKEGSLKLTVNWLYRPGDIKLGKGASLEAAPNEIFYSFHKDEISAASLLHPCKVAFLQKGVELPPGVSSFVCRRVYDTTNKCLYWLTDQDYTDEHQAEVDKLLDKTKHEMQTAAHSQGSSQRVSNAATSSRADTVNTSLTNQVKSSKKRERTDQNLDPIKRERLIKVEDGDSKSPKFEDFVAFADKDRGLTTPSHVEQLVQVMLQERNDSVKKLADVVSRRILLSNVIAATDRDDCLTQLVQLGGLPVLDDWLQEAHKGKIGDGSPKEGEKGLEELLLTLLRALDKLPVDLEALRSCMIGKSVNNLKSHKNSEVQKKARKLVDTWKKRVDAEMKSSDEGKSGQNTANNLPSKPSSESQSKKDRSVSGSKIKPAMNGSASLGDAKYNVTAKEHAGTSKENSLKSHHSGTSEVLAPVKEEKSCSSSQSHNNSQSWCTGSGKGVGQTVKEEAKSPVAGSISNKTSGSGATLRSHSHKSHTGHQKESSGRHRSSGHERASNASFVEKGVSDGNRGENLNSQRLIVRIPNPARSPAQSASGGSLVDASTPNIKGSSPVSADKHESVNGSNRAPIVNSPDISGDAKCGNTNVIMECKEDIDRSSIATAEENYKSTGVERSKDHTTGKESLDANIGVIKNENPAATAGSSHTSPEGVGLDSGEGGIDLLASVATGEGSETEKSFTGSTIGEVALDGNRELTIEGKIKLKESESRDKDGEVKQNQDEVIKSSVEQATSPAAQLGVDLPQDSIEAPAVSISGKCAEVVEDAEVLVTSPENAVEDVSKRPSESALGNQDGPGDTPSDPKDCLSRQTTDISNVTSSKVECQTTEVSLAIPTSGDDESGEAEKIVSGPDAPDVTPLTRLKVGDVTSAYYEEDALDIARQVAKEVEEEVENYEKPESQDGVLCSPIKDVPKAEKTLPEDPLSSYANTTALDTDKERLNSVDVQASSELAAPPETREHNDYDSDKPLTAPAPQIKRDQISSPDRKVMRQSDVENVPAGDGKVEEGAHLEEEQPSQDVVKESTQPAGIVEPEHEDSNLTTEDKKVEGKDIERPIFDLNEGLATDDNVCPESPVNASDSSLSTQTAQTISVPPPISVVSASKGGFVPPSNVNTAGDLCWKGSAATSAFRPAEPRRTNESSQPSVDAVATLAKQNRLLDIDLNVADERVVEDLSALSSQSNAQSALSSQIQVGCFNDVANQINVSSSSRPELDLNRVDGVDENIGPSVSVPKNPDVSSENHGSAVRVMLDFDLNDGPSLEEAVAEEVAPQQKEPDSLSLPLLSGIRQASEFMNASPWYSAPNSAPPTMVVPTYPSSQMDSVYPAMPIPNVKPVINTSQNHVSFHSDIYRVPPISSSVSYSSPLPTAFPYAGFPFGTSFPFTSASYSLTSASHVPTSNPLPFPVAAASQLVSSGTVVPPYGRQFLMGASGDVQPTELNASWARPSLDLNAGPDIAADSDSRDGVNTRIATGLAQFSYQQSGSSVGPVKRKEPDSSFDHFRPNFKQMSWR